MKKRLKWRLISQIFFLVLVGLISINHSLSESGKALPIIGQSSLHAICPYGGVEAFFAWLNYDVLVQKVQSSSFVLAVIIFVTAIIWGPVVCSYVCPLGTVQELVGRLGKKIMKKKYNHMVPIKLDKILRYGRYIMLIVTVYLTTNSLRLVFLEIDPYYALFNFWSSEVALGAIIVLLLTLVGSLFIERPWCKYACPFGALVGLSNLFSVFKIRRNKLTCIDCQQCDLACPMNIDISTRSVIKDHQCIRCMACTSDEECPVEDTVSLKVKAYKEDK